MVMLPFPARVAPPVPDALRRPLATVALFAIAAGLAWAADAAGWPREQALVVAILAATVLLWVTEALPLFATAFTSIASQLFLLGNPGDWSWLGFERGDGPASEAFLAAAADPVLLLFFGGLVLARAATIRSTPPPPVSAVMMATGMSVRLHSPITATSAARPARRPRRAHQVTRRTRNGSPLR